MSVCRRFTNYARKSKFYLCRFQKYYSSSVEVNSSKAEEIIIPYRIHRGPTDILKALASTVSKDFTAPQYKYEDDPYFIPASNITKRAYALSKESGRKAARYFLEKYPELFKCNTSVPHIKAFHPPVVYSEENVTSADTLIECITNFDINNSVIVYGILKKKGIPINQAIKQDLLELLCFYNGSQPLDEDYYEERYFRRLDERNIEKWNTKGMAEELFKDMEKDYKSYSAMIAGTAKFQQSERALVLLDEMRNKNLSPTIEAYNSILTLVPKMQDMGEMRWEFVLNLLSNMDKDGLTPNLYTMNAVLEILSKSKKWRKHKSATLTLLAEMKRLDITPSLGTYSLLLTIFCSEYDSDISVLYEVLNKLEGEELSLRHPLDVTFFSNAMEKCYKFAQDKELAYRINNLVELKTNCKLLGNAFSESRYFKYFFKILCELEDLNKFMEIYEQYVPNIYTPEPAVMLNIIENIHFTGLYKYLPKLCSDILVFEHTERENILSLAMEAAGIMKHDKQTEKDLVYIIWKIVEKLNTRLESGRFNFKWTGFILGNILNTFLYGEDLEKSWSIMERLVEQEQNIIGFPEKDTLLKFCELFLQNQEYNKVKFCIKYAINGAYPDYKDDFKKLTDDMFEKQKLETKHRSHINSILNSLSDPVDTSDSSSDSSSSDEDEN